MYTHCLSLSPFLLSLLLLLPLFSCLSSVLSVYIYYVYIYIGYCLLSGCHELVDLPDPHHFPPPPLQKDFRKQVFELNEGYSQASRVVASISVEPFRSRAAIGDKAEVQETVGGSQFSDNLFSSSHGRRTHLRSVLMLSCSSPVQGEQQR